MKDGLKERWTLGVCFERVKKLKGNLKIVEMGIEMLSMCLYCLINY